MIYLDNAATTKVAREVQEAMFKYMEHDYGNPGSIHSAGRTASRAIQDARVKIGKIINGRPENVIFTSGGSEANSLAILGISSHLEKCGLTHIVTTAVEHKSVLNPLIKLAFDGKFVVTRVLPDKNGNISIDDIKESITSKTGLVSVMGVNNELGNKYDINQIGTFCKEHGILFHTDCVQAFGQIPLNIEQGNIDFLSASAHKIHGPKGTGFLWSRFKGIVDPMILGGSQEFGMRAGTENVPGIVGFGVAAELAAQRMSQEKNEYINKIGELNRRLFSEFGETIHINGMPYEGSKTVNYRFDGVDGETLVLALNSAGVMVSAGSACTAHSAEPSHVLKACGLTNQEARSSIRVSLSNETTMKDVVQASDLIIQNVKMLKG